MATSNSAGDVSFSSPSIVLYPHHMTAREVITVNAGEGLKEARPNLAAALAEGKSRGGPEVCRQWKDLAS